MLRPFPSKQNVSMLRRPYVRPSALTGQRQGDVVLSDDWVTGGGVGGRVGERNPQRAREMAAQLSSPVEDSNHGFGILSGER